MALPKNWRYYALAAGASAAAIGAGVYAACKGEKDTAEKTTQEKTQDFTANNGCFSPPISNVRNSLSTANDLQGTISYTEDELVAELVCHLPCTFTKAYRQLLPAPPPVMLSESQRLGEEAIKHSQEVLSFVAQSQSLDELEKLLASTDQWMNKIMNPEKIYEMSIEQIDECFQASDSKDKRVHSVAVEAKTSEGFIPLEKTHELGLSVLGKTSSEDSDHPELSRGEGITPASSPKRNAKDHPQFSPVSVTYIR